MELYGIRTIPLSWIESYLDNRNQYVHSDGVSSNLLKILLQKVYILYINDICNVSGRNISENYANLLNNKTVM